MNSGVIISCKVGTSDPGSALGFEAWINDYKFFDSEHVQDTQEISVEISDDDAEHELKFVLKNKTPEHTTVDEQGVIVSDARLSITDLAFDEILLAQIVVNKSTYTHNFNGSGVETQEKFYGEMGCNGTVSLKFATPMYLWLLENY
jgi:hypothetical protein